ncbi:hypothetical protein BDW74DRAFT_157239 [Aspergillus multicolor]|uniref:uncharacterized protein n=1 Tax=Aspergillus multicolor TaxID=41759 RepID=UPI003CCCB176
MKFKKFKNRQNRGRKFRRPYQKGLRKQQRRLERWRRPIDYSDEEEMSVGFATLLLILLPIWSLWSWLRF